VASFRWIEWNRQKIARHGISLAEAESVVRNARNPYPRRGKQGRWLVVGRGQGDRLIEVAFLRDPDSSIFIIRAMPLSTRRRRG
jgi:uncharacterized DUF497 family protein